MAGRRTPIRTTDGTIALCDLQAQIEGPERIPCQSRHRVRRVGGILSICLRCAGTLGPHCRLRAGGGTGRAPRGRIADRGHGLRGAGTDAGHVSPLRGRPVRSRSGGATRHRPRVADGRAGGCPPPARRAEEALALARTSADRRPGFPSLAALAVLHAERGKPRPRNRCLRKAALATAASRHSRWRCSTSSAAGCGCGRTIPSVPEAGLLPPRSGCQPMHPPRGISREADAALGDADTAIARLRPLTVSADDPDYAAQLARILGAAGQGDEARLWRARAGACYDQLIARHPAAFADHAAEFWLGVGGDPQRALGLARLNADARRTPHAVDLLAGAALGERRGRSDRAPQGRWGERSRRLVRRTLPCLGQTSTVNGRCGRRARRGRKQGRQRKGASGIEASGCAGRQPARLCPGERPSLGAIGGLIGIATFVSALPLYAEWSSCT